MKAFVRRAAVAVALVSLASWSAFAATQMILGKKLQVKDPTGEISKRKVSGQGFEKLSPATVMGDPTLNGATLEVIANGDTSSDQTFTLPKEGWSRIGPLGFKYSNKHTTTTTDRQVKKASIKKTPSGVFQIKVLVQGKYGTVSVVPPNHGDDGGFILSLTMGDSYCVAFGGTAGGAELRDDAALWYVRSATARACPAPGGTTTTTVAATTTTATTMEPTTTTTEGSTTTTTEGSTTTTEPSASTTTVTTVTTVTVTTEPPTTTVTTTTATTSTTVTTTTATTTTVTIPLNDCGGSNFPECGGDCAAHPGTECAIVFANPMGTDGGCACVPVGPTQNGCRAVPPGSCPSNPVCPPGTACFANVYFGGGCGCFQTGP